MPDNTAASIYEFGEFVMDGTRMLLRRRDGEVVTPAPKASTFSRCLSREPVLADERRTVSEVWRGVIVEEGNLTQKSPSCVKLLARPADEHRYIVTCPVGATACRQCQKSNGGSPQ